MLTKSRSRIVPLAAVMLLLAVTAASVEAASPKKSFDASFCFTQRAGEPAGTGDVTASVSWSGYRVDGVSIGVGDGTGVGFGFVEPVEPASRTGRVTVSIGVENAFPVGGVDIRLGNHVWVSRDQNAPSGNWANLSACA